MKSLIVFAVLLSLVFVPLALVFAASHSSGSGDTGCPSGGTSCPSGATGGGVTLPNPLGGQDFITILKKVVNFLILVAIPITALMIIYGAYQIMFAGGNTEKVKTGKNTILFTVIAFVIILLAWSVIAIIQNILGVRVVQ